MKIVITWFCVLLCVRLLDGSCTKRCQTQVTVDQGRAESPCTTGSLANLTCSSLEDVLLSVMYGRTAHEVDGCILIAVLPGAFVIGSRITITQNVAMCGMGPVSVAFQLLDDVQQAADGTYHALRFQNASSAEIGDIDFTYSQGVVVMENVTTAVVSSCSFR